MQLWRDMLDSPLGEIIIIASHQAVVYVDFADNLERQQRLLTQRYGTYDLVDQANPHGATQALTKYFAGDLGALENIPVDLGGTPFQHQVWQTLRTIPVGSTKTYGEIARQLGMNIGAARAIGITNSLNPISIILPCHRVIGANNALTGYAGGLERKRWLLLHEGALQDQAKQEVMF